MDSTKKCPFCAEEIARDAVKCKHCGEYLTDAAKAESRQGKQNMGCLLTTLVVLAIIALIIIIGV